MKFQSKKQKLSQFPLKRKAEVWKEWQKLIRAGSHTPASQQVTWRRWSQLPWASASEPAQEGLALDFTSGVPSPRPCWPKPVPLAYEQYSIFGHVIPVCLWLCCTMCASLARLMVRSWTLPEVERGTSCAPYSPLGVFSYVVVCRVRLRPPRCGAHDVDLEAGVSTEGGVDLTCVQFGSRGKNSPLPATCSLCIIVKVINTWTT